MKNVYFNVNKNLRELDGFLYENGIDLMALWVNLGFIIKLAHYKNLKIKKKEIRH